MITEKEKASLQEAYQAGKLTLDGGGNWGHGALA
jgi:hypothetical protein